MSLGQVERRRAAKMRRDNWYQALERRPALGAVVAPIIATKQLVAWRRPSKLLALLKHEISCASFCDQHSPGILDSLSL